MTAKVNKNIISNKTYSIKPIQNPKVYALFFDIAFCFQHYCKKMNRIQSVIKKKYDICRLK